MYSLVINRRDALDKKWYKQLQAVATEAAEIYYALEPSAAYLREARRAFVASNYRTNPQLRPEQLDVALYRQRTSELLALQESITATEKNKEVRQAYANRIDELLLQLRILGAGYDESAEAFTSANQAVYGTPNSAIFAATCTWYRNFSQQQLAHPDKRAQKTATRLLELLPKAVGDVGLIIPSDDVFATVKTLHTLPESYLAQLLAGVSVPAHVTAETGTPILEKVLCNIGCDYTVVETSGTGWGVSHARRAVLCPKTYVRTQAAFMGIVTHEIGSHLLERINGLRQPLRLLAIGLDRYDVCNEGRANLREQILFDSPAELTQQDAWRHITTMHLAISLASGLDGRAYDFAKVYEVICYINMLWQQLNGLSGKTAEKAAHDKTWSTTTRVLKGTDGAGGAYLKDMVYLEGNVRCWQLAKTQPEMILYGDLGKFDITRTDHVALLRELGILPSES